jgi:hypothetical protein
MRILSEIEISEIVINCETKLNSDQRIPFSFDKKWTNNFPKEAGIYAIFLKGKLIYIGESANLKERMKEVKRTYNHTFRRKLGVFLYSDAKVIKGKFSAEIELELNKIYLKDLEFKYIEVNFGRIEIESRLIQKNEDLLNSKGKRNKSHN